MRCSALQAASCYCLQESDRRCCSRSGNGAISPSRSAEDPLAPDTSFDKGKEMAENGEEKTAQFKSISRKDIEWLLITVLHLPRYWAIVSVLFVLLSVFDLSWTGKTGFSLALR